MADISHIDTAEHVVSHIDEAIKQGWIKVFYQPVVRAITGQLCGVESLARWIDPDVGFLSPDKFISALEEHKLIHKLDCYVVEQVCMDIQERILQDKPVVPVSVNFSRLDFIMCDMLEVVESNVRKYEIPRDFLHIEITESMIVSDEELMAKVIKDFRSAGYEIWMDDFGSGYSSLTLLKDYDFDLLKLDMRFLSSFTEKAQNILCSTITMAKDIGIRTLAEGVETKEHFEFLREIGCGRIQGFYFGKADPKDDMFTHIAAKGIKVEDRQWRHFFDVVSFNVRNTDSPLEIIFDDGKEFKTLYINEAHRRQLNIPLNISYSEVDKIIYSLGSPILKKYRSFADIMEKTGDFETFYFTVGRNHLCMKGHVIAQHNGCYAIKVSITDITINESNKEKERLDSKLRCLNSQYEVAHLFNIKNNDVDPLIGRNRLISLSDKEVYNDLRGAISFFSEHYVYPDESERYREFMNVDTLKDRCKNNPNGFVEGIFRVKDSDGNFYWKDIVLIPIPKTADTEYLFCMKPLLPELVPKQDNISDIEAFSIKQHKFTVLWENLQWSCSIKFFWKDKHRRFQGVSKAFLDFYNIKSLDDIIGKTDEEMHWHINDDPYKDDELDVVEHGNRVSGVQGQCIVNGVVHNIICSKMPIYDDGEIVGLVGYFVDVDEELERVQKITGPPKVDEITGLMNARAFMDAMIGYAIQCSDKGKQYGIVLLSNKNQSRILKSYGELIAHKVLHRIGEKIVEITGQSCAVARNKEALFAVLTYVDSIEKLQELEARIKANIESIREIDGNSVTIIIDTAWGFRGEPGMTDESIYQETMSRLGTR